MTSSEVECLIVTEVVTVRVSPCAAVGDTPRLSLLSVSEKAPESEPPELGLAELIRSVITN